jgi:imidazoleglycerol-phosphate dehydratase
MAPADQPQTRGRTSMRLALDGTHASVVTGLSVLDHLLELLARYAGFELTLEVEPGGEPGEQVTAAARAIGDALAAPLRADGARGFGSAFVPADEALAHVALDISDRPLVVSNVDLSAERVGGLGNDLAGRFLTELAEAAGLTLHVRLIEGRDTQHVLDAIFKALGVALARACRQRTAGP